jgi:hypothetical protein
MRNYRSHAAIILFIALSAALQCVVGFAAPPPATDGKERRDYSCPSPKEAELVKLFNDYRRSRGLPSVPYSKSLNQVARTHAEDLYLNRPEEGTDSSGESCNLHSWSDKGQWTPICYTRDQQSAVKMWNKPREITHSLYPGMGFEIAYWTSRTEVNPARALMLWQKSPKHNDVILEQGDWQRMHFKALGVGIYRNYAVIWVGTLPDEPVSLKGCR